MRFSRIAVLSALAAGVMTLAGCNCGECETKTEETKAAPGMVGAKEGCSEAKACCKTGEKASMGAVSEKKGCCASKTEATKN